MKLFARKRSQSNVASSRSPPHKTPPPPIVPLELPAEISTPLYERFARTRATTSAGDSEPATPLALFDGSSMGTKAGMRTLMQAADPLEDGPPPSFFSTYVPRSNPPRNDTAPSSFSSPAPRGQSSTPNMPIEQVSSKPYKQYTRPSTADGPSSSSSDTPNTNSHFPRSASAMGNHTVVSPSRYRVPDSRPQPSATQSQQGAILPREPSPPAPPPPSKSPAIDSRNQRILMPSDTINGAVKVPYPVEHNDIPAPVEHRSGRTTRTISSPSAPIPKQASMTVISSSRPPVTKNGRTAALTVDTGSTKRNGSSSRIPPITQSRPIDIPTNHELPLSSSPTQHKSGKKFSFFANTLSSSPIATTPSSKSPSRHHGQLPPAPSSPLPPVPRSSTSSNPPGHPQSSSSRPSLENPAPRARTMSATGRLPSQQPHMSNQRTIRGDTPPRVRVSSFK